MVKTGGWFANVLKKDLDWLFRLVSNDSSSATNNDDDDDEIGHQGFRVGHAMGNVIDYMDWIARFWIDCSC